MVELQTLDGGFVARFKTLASAMSPPPKGIIWGSRFFVLHEVPTDHTEALIYREDFCSHIIEGINSERVY